MYFAGKLVYLIVRPSNQLAITEISISFMYSVICMETIHMHYVLSYFLHKILFENLYMKYAYLM